MGYFSTFKEIWPVLVVLVAFCIHVEVKLARIETNLRWLMRNNKKGGDNE